jgi:hypothetical protein
MPLPAKVSARQKEHALRFAVALFFALAAGLLTAYLYTNKDAFFEWSWQRAEGEFVTAPNKELLESAQKYVDENLKKAGEVCLVEWVGRDDASLYLGVGCASFSEKLGEIFAEGDQDFIPSRLRLKGNEVVKIQRADPAHPENSMRRIFPHKPALALRIAGNRDVYLRRGLEASSGAAAQ